uniref:TILa domain-containing protein n=1 Tax=Apteryx owenii TaxID=8824 RepID=A0A8B9NTL4_APTOW
MVCVAAGECGCEHRGRYYKLGEDFYAGQSCRERCLCQPGGAVACRETSCGPHEECRVERGALGCHAAGYGRLVVAGDPHHVTFDGATRCRWPRGTTSCGSARKGPTWSSTPPPVSSSSTTRPPTSWSPSPAATRAACAA